MATMILRGRESATSLTVAFIDGGDRTAQVAVTRQDTADFRVEWSQFVCAGSSLTIGVAHFPTVDEAAAFAVGKWESVAAWAVAS